jgi:hypothetical protein
MKGVSTKQSVNGWYFKGQDAARRETRQAMRLMPAVAT